MTHAGSAVRPMVVCPLRFELGALQRAGLRHRSALACCGPGGQAVRRWLIAHAPGTAVILAGLAGALDESIAIAQACVISEVVDAQTGRTWRPSLEIAPLDPAVLRCSVTSVPRTVCNPAEKRALRQRCNAQLVDLESVEFARAATDLGLSWSILRGVSDGVDDALPDEVDAWVDSAGRTRLLAVMVSIMRRRQTVRRLLDLRSRGDRAMKSIARLLTSLDARETTRAHGGAKTAKPSAA